MLVNELAGTVEKPISIGGMPVKIRALPAFQQGFQGFYAVPKRLLEHLPLRRSRQSHSQTCG
jgi:hypothetical protein